MKKKILILGTNAGQLDLIKHMKKIGWQVFACSNRQDEVGSHVADKFYRIDISDIDLVEGLAIELKVDLVYSISSDIAIKSAIKVSERLSLPCFYNSDLIDLFDNKHMLREYLNYHKISEVEYIKVKPEDHNIPTWKKFPCMVKPADAQGQRGVEKVTTKEEMMEAIDIAFHVSSSNTVIIEEYLDGVEISCNVLIENKKIIFDILSERLVHDGKLFTIPTGHLIPCINISDIEQEQALSLVHATVEVLDIENGCLYFQMKATKSGIKIIEIAPRLDGCHVWRLIKAATGRDFLAETIECLEGNIQNKDHVKVRSNEKYELIFQQLPSQNKFNQMSFPIPNDAIYHEYRYNDGDDITPINGKLEVVGYYVRQYK